jgi:hypothetical protein
MNKLGKFSVLITKALRNKGNNYSFLLIIFRLIFWKIKYNGGIADFFMLHLEKRGNQFSQIIGLKEFLKVHNKLNPEYYRSVLEDKYVFDRFMSSYKCWDSF